MKIKAAAHSRKVLLELDERDTHLPPIVVSGMDLKKILLPVDFSDASRKAVRYGVTLATQFGSEVLLLHVLEVVSIEGQFMATERQEDVERRLSECRKEFAVPASVKTEVKIWTSAAQRIVESAAEENCDLIIMGNHGRSGLARLLLGSTAEQVVRHAPCPVLVVREREHDFIIETETKSSALKPRAKAATRRG